MHQMPDPLIIQALNNLNCHADSIFHIFNGTEIIMAVYITAWNAKYQGWYGFSCKAYLACVSAAASSYCILVGNAHGIAQFMCVLLKMQDW